MKVCINMEKPKSCAECPFEVIDTSGHTRCVLLQEMIVDGNLFNRCPLEEINLVRCGECKYAKYRIENIEYDKCMITQLFVNKNDFCSYGERRADEEHR